LKAAFESGRRHAPIVDGHVLPRAPLETFGAGEQAAVPLLAGWNLDEMRALETLAKPRIDVAGFEARVREIFGGSADAVLAVYPAASDEAALESAASLRGDLFVGHSSWKWLELHAASGAATYRFSFDRKIPIPEDGWNGVPATAADVGARHAGEIEYVFGALDCQPSVPWEPADRALSDRMRAYWANFARAGDPNGSLPGGSRLPEWPTYGADGGHRVMHLDVRCEARPDLRRARYEVLDALVS
jgi:para-nitrobenzyl esterase